MDSEISEKSSDRSGGNSRQGRLATEAFGPEDTRLVSSRNITDEMIQKYVEEQEGESVTDDSRFPIDPS